MLYHIMGSTVETTYSVPRETQELFEKEILNNPLIPSLPPEIKEAGKLVQFTGNELPSIPINWRFAESVAALKAFEASMLNVLRAKKYNAKLSEVSINTDHASLFLLTPFITQVINSKGEVEELNALYPADLEKCGFRNTDLHWVGGSYYRRMATNIFKTKDGRCYHLHGSMNPEPTLTALGLPMDGNDDDTYDSAAARMQSVVEKHDSKDLDELMNEKYKQAGVIALTVDEFLSSEQGKANDHVGLYEISKDENSNQAPCWWLEQSSMPSSAERPLAGLKVVDLTRVIAAPTITRSLAEMGASVMRVTSPNITDVSSLHQDLNWGKWNCNIDLKKLEDREKLKALIVEADVFVQGYRPGVLDKYGFSQQDIFDMCKDRERGIIYVRENCYGWNGPWQHRSGWQQISDACCGVSIGYGRAMGVDEAVTPVFPNSDYCAGISGSIAILHALIRRADEGGSHAVDVSLNYYSQWLIKSVGTYPDDVWSDLWQKHGSPVFRHYHNMRYLLVAMLDLIQKYDKETIFNEDFFERRKSGAVGREFVQVKPIAQFKDNVQLRYNVGTRSNGVDKPIWPKDLSVEIVA